VVYSFLGVCSEAQQGKAWQLPEKLKPALDARLQLFLSAQANGRGRLLHYPREVLHYGSTQFHFASALCDSLSHFQCCESCDFFLLFEKYLSGPANNLRALAERPRRPSSKCFVRLGHGTPHLLIGMLRKGL
jgi:hypothetical protein